MSLILCNQCSQHHYANESHCPHCQALPKKSSSARSQVALALQLGVNMTACGSNIGGEPEYGVAVVFDDTGDTAEEVEEEVEEEEEEEEEEE